MATVSVTLDVKSRLVFPSIMPERGSFVHMSMWQEMARMMALTPAEIEKFEVKVPTQGQIRWNDEKAGRKLINLPDTMATMVIERLKSMDAKGELTVDHLELYKAFLGPPAQTEANDH